MQTRRTVPFRWLLPAVQLLLCFVCLWPMRGLISFEVQRSFELYTSAPKGTDQPYTGPKIVIVVPPPNSSETQGFRDIAKDLHQLRLIAPAALNFPVCMVQLPYIIASSGKAEWVPRGISFQTWRALSWPIVGIIFWWMVGRAMEALQSARAKQLFPRISLIESIFGAVFCSFGILMFIGIFTTTPADQRDIWFMSLLFSGILWGSFGALMITAKFLQWRIGKGILTGPAESAPS